MSKSSVSAWLERVTVKIVSFSISGMCHGQNRQARGYNVVRRGRKGRDFREILGERVGGGTHFLAREREEKV
jgi:hypothetical protein